MFKAVASLLVITCFAVNVIQAEDTEFSKLGSAWLGGGISYLSVGAGGERANVIQASPILRYFPLNHLMVGPSISYTGTFAGGESVHQINVGAEIGGVFNVGGSVIPYIRSGGNLVIAAMSDFGAIPGFNVPISAGLIIPVGKIFGLQIEPVLNLTIIDGFVLNTFGVNFGFCGIGKKSVVSVLQGIGGLGQL